MFGIGDIDYGGWLDEDLVDLKRELKFSRERDIEYSDRVEINYKIAQINAELMKRNINE